MDIYIYTSCTVINSCAYLIPLFRGICLHSMAMMLGSKENKPKKKKSLIDIYKNKKILA